MPDSDTNAGLPASEWEKFFRGAKVLVDKLENAKGRRSKSTIMGNFLATRVNRPVPIQAGALTGTATLRSREGRSNQRQYYFEVVWDGPSQDLPGG